MKCQKLEDRFEKPGRPPLGGRGLKYDIKIDSAVVGLSPSPRRAWIEIYYQPGGEYILSSSPSPRRAWIEIYYQPGGEYILSCRPPLGGRGLKSHLSGLLAMPAMSPSPRRAWIEINLGVTIVDRMPVALPSEGVD